MPNNGDAREIPRRMNYPIPEAAILLGISEKTAWRRVESGALRTVRDGGRRLVPQEAIDEYRKGLPTAEPKRVTAAAAT